MSDLEFLKPKDREASRLRWPPAPAVSQLFSPPAPYLTGPPTPYLKLSRTKSKRCGLPGRETQ